VDFTGKEQPKLAGLYAEGRIETETSNGLTIPATAIWRDGDKASAWRVGQDKLAKVTIALGDRDPRTGDYVLKSGLSEGDKVIRYPSAMLKDGQPVQAQANLSTSMAAGK
jgi:membrane fusion protein (multidrug efflux system)